MKKFFDKFKKKAKDANKSATPMDDLDHTYFEGVDDDDDDDSDDGGFDDD